MNGNDRLERELTTWFADTATPRTPDWTADILTATATMRQRPRWSFPARWLPAAVVPRLPRLTLRPVPWRTIALLAALASCSPQPWPLYVGSRPRVPAPFGPAVNGLVAYSENGNIWTVDPVTGERKAIVSLPGDDVAPRWSRDGTRIAFLRAGRWRAIARDHERRRQSAWSCRRRPFVDADTDSIFWSPNGEWVAVVAARRAAADDIPRRHDHRCGPGPRHPGRRYGGVLAPARRAPTHVHPQDRSGPTADPCPGGGGAATEMHVPDPNLRPGGWTPDGKYFVLHRYDDNPERAWTELLDPETGKVIPLEVAFGRVSNDGKQIVGHRMVRGDTRSSASCPSREARATRLRTHASRPNSITLPGCSGRPTTAGSSRTRRTKTGWVLLDPEGGPAITPVWSERGVESWQRMAP